MKPSHKQHSLCKLHILKFVSRQALPDSSLLTWVAIVDSAERIWVKLRRVLTLN